VFRCCVSKNACSHRFANKEPLILGFIIGRIMVNQEGGGEVPCEQVIGQIMMLGFRGCGFKEAR
jgi:hypothetical protein